MNSNESRRVATENRTAWRLDEIPLCGRGLYVGNINTTMKQIGIGTPDAEKRDVAQGGQKEVLA